MKTSRAQIDVFLVSCTTAVVLSMIPWSAFAATTGQEAWYKVATGVIAIPAAVIGLIVSINLIKKTNLESRKLELEIREKQGALDAGTQETGQALRYGLSSMAENQRGLILLIRFILLDLAIRFWNVVPSVVGYVTDFASMSVIFMVGADGMSGLEPGSLPMMAMVVGPKIISISFSLVYWFMVFGFGWPLLKDTCSYLGISFKGIFHLPFIGRAAT